MPHIIRVPRDGGRLSRLGFGRSDLALLAAAVIAIFGLAGPVVTHARSISSATQCSSNLRQIGRATMLYMADHDELFPFAYGEPGVDNWFSAIGPYVSARHPKAAKGSAREWNVFHCPADRNGPSPVSYATNALLAGANHAPGVDRPLSIGAVRDPTRVVWAGETNKLWSRRDGYYDTIADWVRPEEDLGYSTADDRAVAFYRRWLKERDWTDLQAGAFDCPDGLYLCKYPAYRHGRTGEFSGSCNFVFVDGHAHAYPWGSLNIDNFFPYPTSRQLAVYNH